VSFSVASTAGGYTGEVDFVDPNVTLPARTIEVRAHVGNRDRTLRAGMFIEVRLATDVRPQATVIPEDALLPLEGAVYVWVVADGTAERREVETGVRFPGFVEILNGLDPGEQVVVGGLERLFPGAPVAPTVVERS
jgi:RND family efflux transporter MFP subunit